MEPMVICPVCQDKRQVTNVFIAQSNQNIIYECLNCNFSKRNIETKKG